MIRADQIPPEVAKLIRDKIHHGVPAERAVAEGLAAWPRAELERIGKGYEWPLTEEYTDRIILPLPQEARDE